MADRLEKRRMKSLAKDLDRLGNNHRVPDPERTGLISRLKEEGVNLDFDRRSPVGIPAKGQQTQSLHNYQIRGQLQPMYIHRHRS